MKQVRTAFFIATGDVRDAIERWDARRQTARQEFERAGSSISILRQMAGFDVKSVNSIEAELNFSRVDPFTREVTYTLPCQNYYTEDGSYIGVSPRLWAERTVDGKDWILRVPCDIKTDRPLYEPPPSCPEISESAARKRLPRRIPGQLGL